MKAENGRVKDLWSIDVFWCFYRSKDHPQMIPGCEFDNCASPETLLDHIQPEFRMICRRILHHLWNTHAGFMDALFKGWGWFIKGLWITSGYHHQPWAFFIDHCLSTISHRPFIIHHRASRSIMMMIMHHPPMMTMIMTIIVIIITIAITINDRPSGHPSIHPTVDQNHHQALVDP